jgi:hypothetical protein
MLSTSLLALSLLQAAASPLEAVRVQPPAFIERGEGSNKRTLPVRAALREDDVISTERSGRVSIQFNQSGLWTLSGNSRLRLLGFTSVGQSSVALEQGSLRIDARTANGYHDVRIKIDDLSVRVYGSEAWISKNSEGRTLCLLQGGVEAQLGAGQELRLDRPQECLQIRSNGVIRRYLLATDSQTSRQFVATAFLESEEDPSLISEASPTVVPVVTPVLTPAPPPEVKTQSRPIKLPPPKAEAKPELKPELKPEAKPTPSTPSAPSAPASAPASTPPSTNGEWGISIASFTEASIAQREAAKQKARVVETDTASGKRYRVVVGSYASLEAARSAAAPLKGFAVKLP